MCIERSKEEHIKIWKTTDRHVDQMKSAMTSTCVYKVKVSIKVFIKVHKEREQWKELLRSWEGSRMLDQVSLGRKSLQKIKGRAGKTTVKRSDNLLKNFPYN